MQKVNKVGLVKPNQCYSLIVTDSRNLQMKCSKSSGSGNLLMFWGRSLAYSRDTISDNLEDDHACMLLLV